MSVPPQLTQYVVYRRPLFLRNLELHPIPSSPSHKHLITLVEKTSLDQRVALYSLQAARQEEKVRGYEGGDFTTLFVMVDLSRYGSN